MSSASKDEMSTNVNKQNKAMKFVLITNEIPYWGLNFEEKNRNIFQNKYIKCSLSNLQTVILRPQNAYNFLKIINLIRLPGVFYNLRSQ